MAQHQRQEDNNERWESPLRKVARNSARRREYTQILKEVQQRPQTGPLRPIRIEEHIDTPDGWYGYVDALEQQRQQRLKLEAREHADRMNTERERTQRHILNILASINPFPKPRDTGEISLSGIAAQETVPMPAVSSPLERSRETKAPRLPEEVAPFLDDAIRLFVWQYNMPPTHIRLSSYNYRQLALEYNNTILSAYTNQRGTFHLVPDYQLDDTTVICEQHVMQQ